MFKKPLSHVKTSAPLRSSDRRKLRQRVQTAYGLGPEDADALVPEGVMSLKFMTHVDAQGVAYLSPDGEPLWFTVGKSADDPLLPSVYTLWKKQDLLPFVSTPAAVLPILVGGADLMVPGVVHAPPGLASSQLVCIRQYISSSSTTTTTTTPTPSTPALSAPIAVGRLALPSDALRHARAKEETNRGKAVLVVHTWKDHLWEMGVKGSKTRMPPDTPLLAPTKAEAEEGVETEEAGEMGEWVEVEAEAEGEMGEEASDKAAEDEDADADDLDATDAGSSRAASPPPSSSSPPPSAPATTSAPTAPGITYTPAEVSALLELALLQALATRLSPNPSAPLKAAFPMPATRFYTDYILPCRPGFPTRVVPPSSLSTAQASSSTTTPSTPSPDAHDAHDDAPPTILTPLTPKSSTHKSLAAFLRAQEKAGLISLKHTPKQDPLVTAVHADHPRVAGHTGFVTEAQLAGAAQRKRDAGAGAGERGEGAGAGAGGEGTGRVLVRELWAPEGAMRGVFDALGVSASADPDPDADADKDKDDQTKGMYTAQQIKQGLNSYIARAGRANAGDPAYVDLDEVLLAAVGAGSAAAGSAAGSSSASGKKAKGKEKEKAKGTNANGEDEDEPLRWLRRDELARRVMASKKLQAWHEIRTGHQGVLLRKGPLYPISVTCKTRAGRKVVTSVVGFEPFLSMPYISQSGAGAGSAGSGETAGAGTEGKGRGASAEEMAEDLRKLCAGATTVGPTPTGGFKLPNGALSQTVTVQGKQVKAVLEYLVGKGVPKEWVSVDPKDLK